MSKSAIVQWLDEQAPLFYGVARQIWERPELAYTESFAASLQMKVLQEAGFAVRPQVGGVATAFVAEYSVGDGGSGGSGGGPKIGVLGEFDALPGLSQQAGNAERCAVVPGGPGHGCGHNLLGTAGVAAVMALKERMAAEGLPGTIRYYGCPAEEVLAGKTFMAREGVFHDLDCAVSWHPGYMNSTINDRNAALTSVEFHFRGKTAHAGGSPHLGRSALDAVELMNVGANYMREHVVDGSRIQYVITNGGMAPNIVPDEASVWYFLRGFDRDHVDGLYAWLLKIAQGAALMTETQVSWQLRAGCYDTLPNAAMGDLMLAQAEVAGPLLYSEEDYHLAQELVATLDAGSRNGARRRLADLGANPDDVLAEGFFRGPFGNRNGGSTDLADISWIVPVGQVGIACAPVGVANHTWQATASYGSPLGMKGMLHAAKIMALSGYDLLHNQDGIIENAKDEFTRLRNGKTYVCALPADVQPPASVPVTVPAG
ncbi:amidohydrolase [Paenibacillus koleovorans]|uniref:amidohydrolase n=1 Tax=Paenibacillus koleovorans TaxID=121608 RepID=UPI000FDBD764|nr:amidohydrolase [Paenibacillus koleovorans]